MPERVWIFEGGIDIPDVGRFHYACYADIDENSPEFTFVHEIKDPDADGRDKDVCEAKITFSITNPIEVVAIGLVAAKLYGFCVGRKLTAFTAKKAKAYYKKSKEEQPTSGWWDHVKNVTKNKAGIEGAEFGGEARKALESCVPFRSFFSNNDDGNDDPDDTDMPDI